MRGWKNNAVSALTLLRHFGRCLLCQLRVCVVCLQPFHTAATTVAWCFLSPSSLRKVHDGKSNTVCAPQLSTVFTPVIAGRPRGWSALSRANSAYESVTTIQQVVFRSVCLSLPAVYWLPVCRCSQVVVSGPAGFVFHVEGLLADLRIPPEAVVILD